MINQYRLKSMAKSTMIHAFLITVMLTCLFPLYWMVRSALMSNETIFVNKSLIPGEFNIQNFYLAWTEGNFGVYFLNSVFYTTCVVAGIVLVSSLAAFAFSRLDFRS